MKFFRNLDHIVFSHDWLLKFLCDKSNNNGSLAATQSRRLLLQCPFSQSACVQRLESIQKDHQLHVTQYHAVVLTELEQFFTATSPILHRQIQYLAM